MAEAWDELFRSLRTGDLVVQAPAEGQSGDLAGLVGRGVVLRLSDVRADAHPEPLVYLESGELLDLGSIIERSRRPLWIARRAEHLPARDVRRLGLRLNRIGLFKYDVSRPSAVEKVRLRAGFGSVMDIVGGGGDFKIMRLSCGVLGCPNPFPCLEHT